MSGSETPSRVRAWRDRTAKEREARAYLFLEGNKNAYTISLSESEVDEIRARAAATVGKQALP